MSEFDTGITVRKSGYVVPPMTDAEVESWLSDEERWAFDRAVRELAREDQHVRNADGTIRVSYAAGPWQATIGLCRTLAETRRALEDCHGSMGEDSDPLGIYTHTVLASMPRPKEAP